MLAGARSLFLFAALVCGCDARSAEPPAIDARVTRGMPASGWPPLRVAWHEPIPHHADVAVRAQRCDARDARLTCTLGLVNQGEKPVEVSIEVAVLSEGEAIDTVRIARELSISPREGVVLEADREVAADARIEVRGAIDTPEKR